MPTSDSACSEVSPPWASAAEFNAETDTATLSQPTSSVLILSSEDQSGALFLSLHGQLEMIQSVGSSHAARGPYFCSSISYACNCL